MPPLLPTCSYAYAVCITTACISTLKLATGIYTALEDKEEGKLREWSPHMFDRDFLHSDLRQFWDWERQRHLCSIYYWTLQQSLAQERKDGQCRRSPCKDQLMGKGKEMHVHVRHNTGHPCQGLPIPTMTNASELQPHKHTQQAWANSHFQTELMSRWLLLR